MKILTTRLSTIMLMVFNYQYLHCECCGKSNDNKTKSTRSTTATNPPFTPTATHPAKPDGSGDKKIKGVEIPKPVVTPTPYINTKKMKNPGGMKDLDGVSNPIYKKFTDIAADKKKEINKTIFKGEPKLSIGEDIEVLINDINCKKTSIKLNSCVEYNDLEKTLIDKKLMMKNHRIVYDGKILKALMSKGKTIGEIYTDKSKPLHIVF